MTERWITDGLNRLLRGRAAVVPAGGAKYVRRAALRELGLRTKMRWSKRGRRIIVRGEEIP